MASLSSFRLNNPSLNSTISSTGGLFLQTTVEVLKKKKLPPHSSHPPLSNLLLLVFEAVLEVVCVAFPGYIIARQGMFDAEAQKFMANLNVSLFTPCLIFTKLASQLTVDKLVDLAIIPLIFSVMTLVSFGVSVLVSRMFNLKRRARNFVIAMGVFGNSNSLPISLVLSLSFTLKGLHWDKIPGDNDNDVAARGILYLLIFQQLGQLVRWSWGYHVLLASPHTYSVEDGGTAEAETGETTPILEGGERYRDEPESIEPEAEPASSSGSSSGDSTFETNPIDGSLQRKNTDALAHLGYNEYEGLKSPTSERNGSFFGLTRTLTGGSSMSANVLRTNYGRRQSTLSNAGIVPPTNGNGVIGSGSGTGLSNGTILEEGGREGVTSFPNPSLEDQHDGATNGNGVDKDHQDLSRLARVWESFTDKLPTPPPWLAHILNFFRQFAMGLWAFMNPPLWAMLLAIIIASVPALQRVFFTPGTFIQNSVTRSVSQMGNVAVPLILVVLGANLAGNTQPKSSLESDPNVSPAKLRAAATHDRKLLIASLISRMLLPTLIIAPLLALTAKYVPVSILDDPIFVIVCFLLTGAPSALQLAQICQINGVYEKVMARILFWGYVVVILPSTLVLVICGLEVVEWAGQE